MAAGEGLMFAWELDFEDVLEVGSQSLSRPLHECPMQSNIVVVVADL